MPLITVKAGTPAVAPGTYVATLIGIAPKNLVTKFSKNGEEQAFLEWTWDIAGSEVRSLTTTATGPKSRIFEYLVALLGADKVQIDAGFEEDDLVGKSALLQIVEDEGFSKVDRVMGAPKGAAAPAAAPAPVAAAAAPAPAVANDDDLPF